MRKRKRKEKTLTETIVMYQLLALRAIVSVSEFKKIRVPFKSAASPIGNIKTIEPIKNTSMRINANPNISHAFEFTSNI